MTWTDSFYRVRCSPTVFRMKWLSNDVKGYRGFWRLWLDTHCYRRAVKCFARFSKVRTVVQSTRMAVDSQLNWPCPFVLLLLPRPRMGQVAMDLKRNRILLFDILFFPVICFFFFCKYPLLPPFFFPLLPFPPQNAYTYIYIIYARSILLLNSLTATAIPPSSS